MRVAVYDTTLRDGTQMLGINFSVEDKIRIAKKLDNLGVSLAKMRRGTLRVSLFLW